MNTYPLTIYYDAACAMCDAEMANLRLRDGAGRLRFENVQAPGFVPPQGTSMAALLEQIHARTADGRLLRGVPVLQAAYEGVGLGWVMMATRWPLLNRLANASYPWIARNRYRIPPVFVRLLFGRALRRAAERAAARRCDAQGICRR